MDTEESVHKSQGRPRLLFETAPIPGIASRIYIDTNHMNRENDDYQSLLRRRVLLRLAVFRLAVNGLYDRPKSEEVKRTLETCLFQACPAADDIDRQITLVFPPCSTPLVGDRRIRLLRLDATAKMRHKVQNDIMGHERRGLSVPVVSA
jgi:hypothetical protein